MSKKSDKWVFYGIIIASLFLAGCASLPSLSREVYLVGVILHDINDATSQVIEPSNYNEYNFTYNLPGYSPEYYQSIFYFVSPSQNGWAASHITVPSPFTQTFYSFIELGAAAEFYSRGFSFGRSVYLNYLHKEDYCRQFYFDVSQEENTMSILSNASGNFVFGGPYLPASVELYKNGEEFIVQLDGALLRGQGTKILKSQSGEVSCVEGVLELPVKPEYALYMDGEFLANGSLLSSGGSWSEDAITRDLRPIVAGHNYILNLSIPSLYPLYNLSVVTAYFSTAGEDFVPPKLKSFFIAPRFGASGKLEVKAEASDNVALASVEVYWRNEQKDWKEIKVSNDNELPSGSISVSEEFNPQGEYVELMIVLTDTAENKQTYIMMPVSFSEKELTLDITQEPSVISPGTEVRFFGNVSDFRQRGAGNLKISQEHNSQAKDVYLTGRPFYDYYGNFVDGGAFDFNITIPASYKKEDSFSLLLGNTGVYNLLRYVVSGAISLFDKDVAVLGIETSRFFYAGNTSINVSVANVGAAREEVEVKASLKYYSSQDSDWWFDFEPYAPVVKTQKIMLGVGETQDVSFEFELVGGEGLAGFSAEAVLSGDKNTNNNLRVSKRDKVFLNYDAGISISGSANYYINEEQNVSLWFRNNGLRDMRDINYTLGVAPVNGFGKGSKEEAMSNLSIILTGEIDNLNVNEELERQASLDLSESGEYIIVAWINSTQDVNKFNDMGNYWIRVRQPGADLTAYINTRTLVAGENSSVEFQVVNDGNKKSGMANVSFFIYDYEKEVGEGRDGKVPLFNNLSIPPIEPNAYFSGNFYFMPERKGGISIYSYVDYEADIDKNNNNNGDYVFVLSKGKDIATRAWSYGGDLSVGETARINWYVDNVGSEKVDSFNVSFFVNGEKKDEINYSGMAYANGEFNFVPENEGTYLIEVNATTEEDVDLSDNLAGFETEIFSKRNIIFNVKDSAGANVTRILELRDGRFLVNAAPFVAMSVIGRSYFGILLSLSEVDERNESFQFIGQSFYIEHLPDENNITSEFYGNLTAGNDRMYGVFANNISFSEESSFAIWGGESIYILNESNFKRLGINPKFADEYVIAGCGEFNFVEKKCSGNWSDEGRNHFESEKYRGQRFYFYGFRTYDKIMAFGLREASGFSGETTDLDKLPGEKVRGVVFEKRRHGKVKFNDEVNISRLKDNEEFAVRNILIKDKEIFVNTTELPEFINVSASIVFRNVDFRNPQILRDGVACGVAFCSSLFFNATEQEVFLNVSGFSGYKVVEGSFCGDNQCSGGESCNVCVADCGLCGSAGGGGGGSSGGGSGGSGGGSGGSGGVGGSGGRGRCKPVWGCDWGLCVDNIQKYNCYDKNYCATQEGKPAEKIQVCAANARCVDMDGDGFGIGVDCKGPDSNDNDPAMRDIPIRLLGKVELPSAKQGVIIFVLFSIALGVILLGLLAYRIYQRNEWQKVLSVVNLKKQVDEMRVRGYSYGQIKEFLKSNGISDEMLKKVMSRED